MWTCLNPSGNQIYHGFRDTDSLSILIIDNIAPPSFLHKQAMSSLDDLHPQASTHTTTKPPRTLACTSCQNRKVKCDRKFPCSSCIKSNVQCIPSAAPRQRRRRFPEAELLQRVRYLEDLLRQHDIEFEPLHGNATEKSENKSGREGKRKGSPEVKTETTFEAKYAQSTVRS